MAVVTNIMNSRALRPATPAVLPVPLAAMRASDLLGRLEVECRLLALEGALPDGLAAMIAEIAAHRDALEAALDAGSVAA